MGSAGDKTKQGQVWATLGFGGAWWWVMNFPPRSHSQMLLKHHENGLSEISA